MADSSVTIAGNLTRDPETRELGGATKANLSVAVNHRYQNRKTQEWEETVSFVTVICWRELADNVAASLSKGTRVVVTGRLELRTFDVEGQRRTVAEVVADEIGPSLRFATATVEKVPRGQRLRPTATSAEIEADDGEIF